MNKYESLYRILLSFMLIDNKVDNKEKEIILEYLSSRFGNSLPKDRQAISVQQPLLWFENFRRDAEFAFNNCTTEDRYDLLDFIGKMIKSDWDLDPKEIMLFENLLEIWKIEKDVMNRYWIKKSLWSKFFS